MNSILLNIVAQSSKEVTTQLNPVVLILSSGLTAALASGTVNYFINNRKIHADIVSKSRIDWIQQVRSATSEYLVEVSKYLILIGKIKNLENEKNRLANEIVYKNIHGYNEDEYGYVEEYDEKILDPAYQYHNNKLMEKIQEIIKDIEDNSIESLNQMKVVLKTIHLLRLYFPTKTNKDTNIHVKIKDRMSTISSLLNLYNDAAADNPDAKIIYKYINIEIKEFSELLSNYLKDEWERAKRNKK